MPISRQKKEEIVADISKELAQRRVILFAELKGVPVDEQIKLRAALKAAAARFVVAKKTLARIAFLQAGLPVNPESFPGSLALVFADDIVSASRELDKFAKTHETFLVLGGILREGDRASVFSGEEVKNIARLPAKEVLLAQLLNLLLAPARNLVSVLDAPARNLVIAMNQYSQKGQ